MPEEAVATLVERELLAHNKPNFHVSIITCHTVILISTYLKTAQNPDKATAKNSLLLLEDSRWQPRAILMGKQGSNLNI